MKEPSFKMVLTGVGEFPFRRTNGVYVVPITAWGFNYAFDLLFNLGPETKTHFKGSKQRFMTTNNILSRYQSAAKRDEAILSYGGKVNAAFLTPNIDDEAAFEG